MKFNKNILIMGAALVSLAACQPETKQPTDAEIDALVETKVNEVKASLQLECDNSIMSMAITKADSTMVAMANKPARTITVAAPAPKTTKPTTTKTPTPPKPDPKPSNTNRPGSNQAGNAGNTSRPGADNGGTNKTTEQPSNTSRPGADK